MMPCGWEHSAIYVMPCVCHAREDTPANKHVDITGKPPLVMGSVVRILSAGVGRGRCDASSAKLHRKTGMSLYSKGVRLVGGNMVEARGRAAILPPRTYKGRNTVDSYKHVALALPKKRATTINQGSNKKRMVRWCLRGTEHLM